MRPLAQLADAHGVAVEYWDWQGGRVDVEDATLTAVLTALGVDASSDARQALISARVTSRSGISPK